MKIDTELFLSIDDYCNAKTGVPATWVLCTGSLPDYFDLPEPLPKKITLHLSSEEDENAYCVKFTQGAGEELTVFDDGPSSVITRKHLTYANLDNLLMKFPNNTAWLSISWEE